MARHQGIGEASVGVADRVSAAPRAAIDRIDTCVVGLPTEGVFYSHGAAVGDYDNDGWPDLLVTGYGRLALYRNDHGKFVDVTATAGLADPGPLHWSTSAGWADLNGDGWPDLFVAHYVDWSFRNHPTCESTDKKPDVCSPRRFDPLPPTAGLGPIAPSSGSVVPASSGRAVTAGA